MVTAAQKAKTTREKAEDAVARVEAAAGGEPGKLAPKKETVQQLKNRLRNEAEREVLNKYKPEVIKLTEAKYDEHGLEYVRRLTDEEKAAKEIEEALAKYPSLRKQFEPQPVEEVEGPDYDADSHDYVDNGPVANDFDPQFGAPGE